MLCYFLYWSIQLPFMFVSPQKIRWLFLAKSIIVPPTWSALLIWAFVKVPPNNGLFALKAELRGSELSWAWLSALNSALGSFATLGVNIPDFTVGHNLPFSVALTHLRQTNQRYAKNERACVTFCPKVDPLY
jgi:nucleobase:cation symporter-1, NCS1 family